jgi:hypothetical protein
MSRYQEANADLEAVFNEVITKDFPNLFGVPFKLLFDNKKRMSKGKLVLASMELVTEKLKFFTADGQTAEGYDYLLIVDSVAWEYATVEDKKRLISHELNHVFIDEKGKLKLVGHDVEDFAREIQKNADNPGWASNLGDLVGSIYEQAEDQ